VLLGLRVAKRDAKRCHTGSLAQLVERFVYTEDVGSSSLSRPTIISSILIDILANMGISHYRCYYYGHYRWLSWNSKNPNLTGRITLSQGLLIAVVSLSLK
jgi:hypothetical protein